MIQKPFRGVQLNRTHPLAKGLVGCWLFNEATGETVFDSSGNNNNGTLENGVAWDNDGLEFDGVDDYVDCGNNSTINNLSSYTICARFKTDYLPGPSDYPHLVSQRDLLSSVWSINLHGDFSGQLTFSHLYTTTPAEARVTAPVVGSWYDACFTISDVDNIPHVYINGVESSYTFQNTGVGTMNHNTDVKVAIGNRIGGGRDWDGSTNFVKIYNRVLSADEVAWLCREPYAMFEPAFNPALLYSAAPPVGAIMNQFQKANIGADLYNGAIVA